MKLTKEQVVVAKRMQEERRVDVGAGRSAGGDPGAALPVEDPRRGTAQRRESPNSPNRWAAAGRRCVSDARAGERTPGAIGLHDATD